MLVYADNNATSPIAAEHFDAVVAILKHADGNPSSIHEQGRRAKVAMEDARSHLATLLGARASEIVFTSGATEANNMVLQGVVQKARGAGMALPHIVVSSIEHSSIREPAKILEERGLCRVTTVPVDRMGHVHVDAVQKAIEADTVLVAIMHANNEVGTIQDIQALAGAVKAVNEKIHFHSDAVQMLGKADLQFYSKSPIDSASVSAHKLGGFKGVGALYLRNGVTFAALSLGGGQERGRRPGTENLPGIVSFGLIAQQVLGQEHVFWEKTRPLREAFLAGLQDLEGVSLHGDLDSNLANTVNFHVRGVPGEDVLLNFDLAGIRVSSGSACSSGVGRPSHVLKAMGFDDDESLNSIRVSFHPDVTSEGIDHMLNVLRQTVARVRV